jgi:hypothetical protein
MPTSQLLNLKTDLKSLKFGHDRPSGGDSGEPFVQADITTGTILTTTEKGAVRLLIANELAPLSNLLLSTSPAGIGTVSNVASELINTDSFIRGGLAGYTQASINQNNRVGGFISSSPKGTAFLLNRSLFLVDKATGLTASGVPLVPNQLLNTGIQRAKNAIGLSQTNINYNRVLGVSDKYFSNAESIQLNNVSPFSTILGFSLNKPSQIDQYPKNVQAELKGGGFLSALFAPQNSPQNRRYSNAIKSALNKQKLKPNYNLVNNTESTNFTAADGTTTGREITPTLSSRPTYNNGKSTVTVNIPWNVAHRANYIGSGLQDQINLTPILENIDVNENTIRRRDGKEAIDLVKFRIYAINSDNPSKGNLMIFRAYITEFSDGTEATWNEIRYAGRGEPFFIYNGFSRAINIGFKVAALSSAEMDPMYQKLNFLMGNVMPDYGNDGNGPFMKGPFVRMTVGNWIDKQEGILRNVSYTVPNDSPWEVGFPTSANASPLVLPHIVDVRMTFVPIGSLTGGTNKISGKSTLVTHIGQNNIVASPSVPRPSIPPPPLPRNQLPSNPFNPGLPQLPSIVPPNPFTFQPLGPI